MIYFDNSATTKPYPEVLESFVKVSSDFFGNPSSLHGLGGQAEKLLSHARAQIAGLLGAKTTEILFTSGGTESNNLAIKGAALMHKGRGRHIIATSIEHPSVSNAMEQLEQNGFEITYLPVDEKGIIHPEDVEKEIRDDTILVSSMYVNNEVGSIQPIAEIGKIIKKYPKVLFHVDAVQAATKLPIDLKNSGIDLCSISSHKFHGLKGVGALFVREGVKISPLFSGGEQEGKRRSGTENVAGAVAMAKALRMTMERTSEGIKNLHRMQEYLINELSKIPGILIHTPLGQAAPHIINFSVPDLKSETFIHALEEKDIYVSTTSACSSKRKTPSKTLLAMGVSEREAERSIRVSLSFDNTMEEAATFIGAVKQTLDQLGKVRN